MISIPSFELIPNKKAVVGLLSGLVLSGMSAQAGLIHLSNPAALGTSSVLNWGFGPLFSEAPNNTAFSSGGVTVNATQSAGNSLWVNSQNPIAGQNDGIYWDGNFFPGDSVLYNGVTGFGQPQLADISLHFQKPVLGAGVHVQQNWSGAADFTGFIWAYDVNNVLLDYYSFAGIAGNSADGAAVFAGFLSTSVNISTITISTESQDFAIGALSVNIPDSGSTAALLGSAVAGLWLLRKRK